MDRAHSRVGPEWRYLLGPVFLVAGLVLACNTAPSTQCQGSCQEVPTVEMRTVMP